MTKIIEAITIEGTKKYYQHGGSVLAIPDNTPERVINKALKYPKLAGIFFGRYNPEAKFDL